MTDKLNDVTNQLGNVDSMKRFKRITSRSIQLLARRKPLGERVVLLICRTGWVLFALSAFGGKVLRP
jgi:hypothetical protein